MSSIVGRAPLEAGPAWNEDGTIKLVWARWFNALATTVQTAGANVSIDALLGPSQGANPQSVIITCLGLMSLLANPRPAKAQESPQLSVGDSLVRPNETALALAATGIMGQRIQRPVQPQIIVCTQATFPTLNATNSGSFIYVSDYAHWIYWNGTTPVFADGGSNYYSVAAAAPSSVGWHACDGSSVNYLNADGTVTSKTLANVDGTPSYLRVGAGTDTLVAAIAPTLTMNPNTPAGTINTPTFTGTPATPTGLVAAPVFTGTAITLTSSTFTPVALATVAITSVGGSITTVSPAGTNSAPLFTGDSATPAGTISALTFTGTPATLTGTISSTAQPASFYSKLWFRL